MALKDTAARKKSAGTAAKRPANPFGGPSDDEQFEVLIPEGAESGKIPADDKYIGKLLDVSRETSSNDNPMYVWTVSIAKGPYTGMDFKMWTVLTPNSMWKLADVLTALGIKFTPGKPLRFSRSDVVGTLVRMVITDDKYQGRDVSRLSSLLPHPDGAGKKSAKGAFPPAEEEDEEPPVRRRGVTPVRDSGYEEEDEEPELMDEEPEEEEEDDEAEVRRIVSRQRENAKRTGRAMPKEEEEEEEEEPAPRRGRRPAPVEFEEEEEEDEEPEPVKVRTTVKTPAAVRRNPTAMAKRGSAGRR